MEFRKVITKPGEIIDFETVFEENPTLRTGVPKKKGTVERVDYIEKIIKIFLMAFITIFN